MRQNVNILTSASEAAVYQAVTGYENSAAAHASGDWGAHNQVRFYGTTFAEHDTGHTINGAFLLRVQLTGTNVDGTGDAAFTLPAIISGSTAYEVGSTPYIVRQPEPLSVYTTDPAEFVVKAISPVEMSYQWRFNGTNVANGNTAAYLIPYCTTANSGNYDVVVSNSYGTTVSSSAHLTVSPISSGFRYHKDGCFLPDTPVTMADGTQKLICDVKVGDKVMSYKINGLNPDNEDAWKTWSAKELVMRASPSTVKRVLHQQFTGYFQLLDLRVTYEHPLLTCRSGIWAFRQVQDLVVGDLLWKDGMSVTIDRMSYVRGHVETYNLDVEPTDVYVVNGYVAHNSFWKGFFNFAMYGLAHISGPASISSAGTNVILPPLG
jgi:hypothetical protein